MDLRLARNLFRLPDSLVGYILGFYSPAVGWYFLWKRDGEELGAHPISRYLSMLVKLKMDPLVQDIICSFPQVSLGEPFSVAILTFNQQLVKLFTERKCTSPLHQGLIESASNHKSMGLYEIPSLLVKASEKLYSLDKERVKFVLFRSVELGYTEVVKFLQEYRKHFTLKEWNKALRVAVKFQRGEIVKFIKKNYSEIDLRYALEGATAGGHLEEFQDLERILEAQAIPISYKKCATLAAQNAHRSTLEYILTKEPISFYRYAIGAACSGNIEFFQWVLTLGGDNFDLTFILNKAIKYYARHPRHLSYESLIALIESLPQEQLDLNHLFLRSFEYYYSDEQRLAIYFLNQGADPNEGWEHVCFLKYERLGCFLLEYGASLEEGLLRHIRDGSLNYLDFFHRHGAKNFPAALILEVEQEQPSTYQIGQMVRHYGVKDPNPALIAATRLNRRGAVLELVVLGANKWDQALEVATDEVMREFLGCRKRGDKEGSTKILHQWLAEGNYLEYEKENYLRELSK